MPSESLIERLGISPQVNIRLRFARRSPVDLRGDAIKRYVTVAFSADRKSRVDFFCRRFRPLPYACTATSTKNDDSASDCSCHIMRQPGRRNGISLCEYSHALRLASELADLRTANADRIRLRFARRSPVDLRGDAIKRYVTVAFSADRKSRVDFFCRRFRPLPYACTATSTKNDDSASDCSCHIMRQPGRRNGISLCEYSHALRLASELADLRTANADRIRLRFARRSPVDSGG